MTLGKGRAEAVNDSDISKLANELGCHPADLEAIAKVESGGFGWFADGRIKILFEKHWFYKFLSGAKQTRAVSEGLARKAWVSPANGGYKDQSNAAACYRLLEKAIAIDEEAAFKSVSIGTFQIMGFNHQLCGFPSAKAMWIAFVDSEAAQLRAFANFLKGKGLVSALKARDFAKVEQVYNGGGLNGTYAKRMRTEADKLRAGKWKGWQPRPVTAPVSDTAPQVTAPKPSAPKVSEPKKPGPSTTPAPVGFLAALIAYLFPRKA